MQKDENAQNGHERSFISELNTRKFGSDIAPLECLIEMAGKCSDFTAMEIYEAIAVGLFVDKKHEEMGLEPNGVKAISRALSALGHEFAMRVQP